jgi:hypothetical protein
MENRYMPEYFIPSMNVDYRRNIPGELPVIDIIQERYPKIADIEELRQIPVTFINDTGGDSATRCRDRERR